MQQAKKFHLPLYFLLLGGLLSCGRLTQYGVNDISLNSGGNVTNIHDLTQRDREATVYLKGKVTSVVPLLKQRAYQLQDSTGTIWVLTTQTGLQPGEQVLIKGDIRYQRILQAGKDLGEVYVEEQQLEHVSSR